MKHDVSIGGVHTFFDAYLKEQSASPLKLSSPLYPELELVE
jgi:hypothetical protein